MGDIIQWITVLGMVGIAALFLTELRKWRQLDSVMTRGQRILRGAMFFAVELLFAMMLIGPSVTSHNNPLMSLLYWTGCLIVGLLVVVLVLLDLRVVVRQYARLNRQMFRSLKEADQPEQGRGEHPELRRRTRPEDDGPPK